jgi:hypothetical protein
LSRGGTEKIYQLPDDPTVRLIPFRVSGVQDYVIALNDLEARMFTVTGLFSDAGSGTDLITNGDFSVGTDWTFVDVEGDNGAVGGAYISGGKLYLYSDRDVIDVDPIRYAYVWGKANQEFAVAGAGARTLTFDCVMPGGTSRLYIKVTSASGTKLDTSVTTSGSKSYTVTLAAEDTTIEFSGTGAILGVIEIDNVAMVSGATEPGPLVTPWTADQLEEIQYAQEPGATRMFLTHQGVTPRHITYAAGVFTTGDPAWVAPSWSANPRACEFYQGRLVLAGSPSEPNTFWMSKAGAPLTFTVGTDPDSPIEQALQTRGAIMWIRGLSRLILGTDTGETQVRSQGPVVEPGDIGAQNFSEYGSAPVQVGRIGTNILYVSQDRRKLRVMEYSNEADAIISKDLTFIAEHLTKGQIKEVHYARDPDNTVIVVMKTGTVLGCTFVAEEGIVAWWRVQTTGTVSSACVTDGPEGSILWMAVSRKAGVFLERMYLNPDKRVPLDCQIQVEPDATGLITGLDHLVGEQVHVTVDGAIEKSFELVPVSGEIQLDFTDREFEVPPVVLVGLQFTCTARTLPRDIRGGKGRSPKIGVTLNDSGLPRIGSSASGKTYRPDERTPSTPMDTVEGRKTGKFRVGDLGWDDDAKIDIVQDLPIRTEILNLYAITAENEVK